MSTFDLERQFESDLRNEVWQVLGYDVVKKIEGRLEQRRCGDFVITDRQHERNVDIKAEKNMPANFPIELLQDWRSFDIGWYYTLFDCDEIWYGRYNDSGLEEIYRVSFRLLRRGVREEWPTKKCTKRYGWTIFMAAPLSDLMTDGIAKKVWPT